MRKGLVVCVALLSVLACHDQAPEPANRMIAVAGNDQMADPLHALPLPLTVELQSVDGSPVRGVTVRWTIQSGAGALAADSPPGADITTTTLTTTSGSDGRAKVWVRAGATAGAVQVTATMIESPYRSATFSARSIGTLVMRYDGTSWSTSLADSTAYSRSLRAIWGTSRTSIAALGACGNGYTTYLLLRYNGTSWGAETLPVTGANGGAVTDCSFTAIAPYTSTPRALGGRSMSDLFALGVTRNSNVWVRVVVENDGSGWRTSLGGDTGYPPGYKSPNGIWFGSGSIAYVVSGAPDASYSYPSGDIERYDGSKWTSVHADETKSFLAIWGTAESDLTVVGRSGTILHYDGTNWVSQGSGATADLRSVHGLTSTNIVAVGDGGTIVHYDGTAWKGENSGTTANLYGVYMLSPTLGYAVGNDGVVVKYDGSKWTPATVNALVDFRGVWAASANDVFVVGAPHR